MKFLGILQSILLGIIEGITEWLPVSSTGHMVLFNHFYPSKFSPAFSDMFEYVIQLAAILAVVVIFWKKMAICLWLLERKLVNLKLVIKKLTI